MRKRGIFDTISREPRQKTTRGEWGKAYTWKRLHVNNSTNSSSGQAQAG